MIKKKHPKNNLNKYLRCAIFIVYLYTFTRSDTRVLLAPKINKLESKKKEHWNVFFFFKCMCASFHLRVPPSSSSRNQSGSDTRRTCSFHKNNNLAQKTMHINQPNKYVCDPNFHYCYPAAVSRHNDTISPTPNLQCAHELYCGISAPEYPSPHPLRRPLDPLFRCS